VAANVTKADFDAWCINILRGVQRLNFTPPGETSTEQIVREGKPTDLMTTLNVKSGEYRAALKDIEDCEEILRTTQYKAKGDRGMVEMKARIEHRRVALTELETQAQRPFADPEAVILIEPRQKYYWEYSVAKMASFWDSIWSFRVAR